MLKELWRSAAEAEAEAAAKDAEARAAHEKALAKAAEAQAAEARAAEDALAAVLRLQARMRGWRARINLPGREERHYRATLQAAKRAQCDGQYEQARDLLLHLYCLRGRAETRLSAANMTLRLGEPAAALTEYQHLERTCAHRLGDRAMQVLRMKSEEAARACAEIVEGLLAAARG